MDYRCKHLPTNGLPDPPKYPTEPDSVPSADLHRAYLSKSNIKRTPKTLPDIDDQCGRCISTRKAENLFTFTGAQRNLFKKTATGQITTDNGIRPIGLIRLALSIMSDRRHPHAPGWVLVSVPLWPLVWVRAAFTHTNLERR